MITDKINMLKQESCQKEANSIMFEFRRALLKHFEVVNANATRLINTKWGDDNA